MEAPAFSWTIYLTCALGVVVSAVLPVLRAMLPVPSRAASEAEGSTWHIARPYVVLGAFSLVGAILIVAAAGETLKDWRAALLAGYAWDSTLQKLKPIT